MSKTRLLALQLERAEQQLMLFQKISRLLVRESPLQDTLQEIVGLIVGFMDCDSCLIYLACNGQLVLCASNHPHSDAIGDVRLQLGEGLTGWVARERRLLAISCEAYQDPRFKSFSGLPEDSYEAFLSAPIIAHNRILGVINVQHRQTHQHTGSEMEMLTTVGEQIGCLLLLAQMEPEAAEFASHTSAVLSPAARS